MPKTSCKFPLSRALTLVYNQIPTLSAVFCSTYIESESSAIIQKEKLYRDKASSSHFLPPINSLSLISLYLFYFIQMQYFLQTPYFASLSPLCCPFYLQFYFPGSFSYLPFRSVVKFSLPITTTLPLFAPSVFCPQGVLSQSEANLPNYKPHLLFLFLSVSPASSFISSVSQTHRS